MKKFKPSTALKLIVHSALLHGAALTAMQIYQTSLKAIGPEWQFKEGELEALKKKAAEGSPREASRAKEGDDLA